MTQERGWLCGVSKWIILILFLQGEPCCDLLSIAAWSWNFNLQNRLVQRLKGCLKMQAESWSFKIILSTQMFFIVPIVSYCPCVMVWGEDPVPSQEVRGQYSRSPAEVGNDRNRSWLRRLRSTWLFSILSSLWLLCDNPFRTFRWTLSQPSIFKKQGDRWK